MYLELCCLTSMSSNELIFHRPPLGLFLHIIVHCVASDLENQSQREEGGILCTSSLLIDLLGPTFPSRPAIASSTKLPKSKFLFDINNFQFHRTSSCATKLANFEKSKINRGKIGKKFGHLNFHAKILVALFCGQISLCDAIPTLLTLFAYFRSLCYAYCLKYPK